jgi:pSer/pThr/pTyr-binding forkhead associated (FHA) protein
VIIGRARGDVTPDLDLTPYEAERMGISRRHAMLRPTRDSLLLADVGSTNGTFHNSERVKLGEPKAVQDNDILSFGALHLRVKIASRPAGAAEQT